MPIAVPSHPPVDLVATLGPSSLTLASELVRAGATRLRLNASHMSPEDVHRVLRALRDDDLTAPVPVVVDLQGAKMRFDELTDVAVEMGQVVSLTASRTAPEQLVVPHPELFQTARAGDTLRVDDDRVRLRVVSVAIDSLQAQVVRAGRVRPRKGVNSMGHPVVLGGLTERDKAHVRSASQFGVSFAVSFMMDGSEAAWVHQLAPGCEVIGKVERGEATRRISDVAAATDRVWICRGDLGSQLGLVPMARWISGFDPVSTGKPVLMAGQVFACLERRAAPSRSEVSHLVDLIARGYVGVVLSDETAVGHDPVNAVGVVAGLLRDIVGG